MNFQMGAVAQPEQKGKRDYTHISDPAERRRVRNRESARKARMEKKQYLTTLENNLKNVQDKHEELE